MSQENQKRKVAAVCGDGHIRLVEQDVPELVPGAVLVNVRASLVSPGTELGGWRALRDSRDNPDTEKQPKRFGYSNAGVVAAVGEGVEEFSAGDRVACVGAGYALHTDHAVVPHNLCIALPDEVSFARGSYAMLLATAMQSVRRAEPEFGENVAIAGLGIVGQLTARLHQLAGNYVIGWDTIGFRTETAKRWGIDAVATIGVDDEVEVTQKFTRGYGLDTAVIAFGGNADKAVDSIVECMKISPDGHRMGRVVVVGGANFAYTKALTNMDIRRSSRTGPGYHDEAWEFGPDYPPVVMRWTTRTNLELCMRLLAEGKVDVDALTTHTVPLDLVDEETSKIIEDPDGVLGVVFTMNESDKV
jgi:threonine dehydrogenase-like Zn-dependent dehydrogenase